MVSQCDSGRSSSAGWGETVELVGRIGRVSGLDPLDEARAAVERRDWPLALEVLAASGSEASGAEGFELRARAAYGSGDFEAAVSAWEALHALLVAAGDDIGAARAAAMTAMYLMMDTGLMAPVRGWLRRAERLLEGHGEAPAHAVIAMVRTYERVMCGDIDGARTQSVLAIELGGRLGVLPAVVIGRVAAARVKIFDGHVDEGLDLLDEVGALLMSGDVDALTTGMMYCELICAAQGLALHDRASEWTEVMERWRHGVAFGGINGRCRVHRAELLRVSGPCDLAEEEALAACDELRPWMRREFGWPLAELGNIRLRRGDLAGAEEAYVAADEHAWSPFPGLALLRLEQGDVDSASTFIADAVAHPFNIPSKERPPFGDLRLAPLLDAQAEIAAAAVISTPLDGRQTRCSRSPTRTRAVPFMHALRSRTPGRRWPVATSRRRSMGVQRRSPHGRPSVHRSRQPGHAWCSPKRITERQHRSGTNGMAGSPRSIRSLRRVALGRTSRTSPRRSTSHPDSVPEQSGGDGDIQMRRRHEDHLVRRTHHPDA